MSPNIVILLSCIVASSQDLPLTHFPEYFQFGVATSAQQVEGSWNVSGKGESMWDYYQHTTPFRILDGSSSDVAADSYNRLQEDIALLQQLHVNFYRFSLSWTRLFPEGSPNVVNIDGVRYYNQLINGLLAVGIEPMVTIFHWDLPQHINELGGWTNDLIIDFFSEYATRVFELFGDRVRTWATINEPAQFCQFGYDNQLAPFANNSGLGSYLCGHNVLRAHARAFHIYDKYFRPSQNGRVGIVCDTWWFEPNDHSSALDHQAADRSLQFHFGWFVHAIYSQEGDYPPAMRSRIDYVSKQQAFARSRLPKFTTKEVDYIRGTYDYLGLNHYSTLFVRPDNQPVGRVPTLQNDLNVQQWIDPAAETTEGSIYFAVVPWGMRKLLNWVSNTYGTDIEILITENGYNGCRNESLVDTRRVHYLNTYLQEVLNAINDGVKVTAYTFWSLMDNWEWVNGYNARFGLYRIDYDNDPNLKRVPKLSALVYRNIITTRATNESFIPGDFNIDNVVNLKK